MALPIFARCSGVSVESAAAASAILPAACSAFRPSTVHDNDADGRSLLGTKLSRHRCGAERECGDRNRTRINLFICFSCFSIFSRFQHFTGEVLYCRAISDGDVAAMLDPADSVSDVPRYGQR